MTNIHISYTDGRNEDIEYSGALTASAIADFLAKKNDGVIEDYEGYTLTTVNGLYHYHIGLTYG